MACSSGSDKPSSAKPFSAESVEDKVVFSDVGASWAAMLRPVGGAKKRYAYDGRSGWREISLELGIIRCFYGEEYREFRSPLVALNL